MSRPPYGNPCWCERPDAPPVHERMPSCVVRPAPDPARDARREVYRSRARAAATAAFDRYLDAIYGPECTCNSKCRVHPDGNPESVLHHNGDYGVSDDPCSGGRCSDPWMHAEGGHDR